MNKSLHLSSIFIVLGMIALFSCSQQNGQHAPKGEREDILQCVSPDKAYVATFYREYVGGAAGWQQEYVPAICGFYV